MVTGSTIDGNCILGLHLHTFKEIGLLLQETHRRFVGAATLLLLRQLVRGVGHVGLISWSGF
jgi:hypothetical protein